LQSKRPVGLHVHKDALSLRTGALGAFHPMIGVRPRLKRAGAIDRSEGNVGVRESRRCNALLLYKRSFCFVLAAPWVRRSSDSESSRTGSGFLHASIHNHARQPNPFTPHHAPASCLFPRRVTFFPHTPSSSLSSYLRIIIHQAHAKGHIQCVHERELLQVPRGKDRSGSNLSHAQGF